MSRLAGVMNGAQGGSARIISTSRSAHSFARALPLSRPIRAISRLYFGLSKYAALLLSVGRRFPLSVLKKVMGSA